MVFTSVPFLVLFITIYLLILIFNIKWIREKFSEKTQLTLKHTILLIASYIFYGWWDYRFCFLMFLLTFVAWLSAKNIYEKKHIKLFTVIGVVFPLMILGFFKYFNFFVDSFIVAFGLH
ncbi:MAG: MBOAT family protein, partial [Clostridia bacterium]|nr:MBOAT family protein [Clostridia bacterium]